MLVCCRAGGCVHGLHLKCSTPPLAEPPADFWLCSACEKQREKGVPLSVLEALSLQQLQALFACFLRQETKSANRGWLQKRLRGGLAAARKAAAATGQPGRRPTVGLGGGGGAKAEGGCAKKIGADADFVVGDEEEEDEEEADAEAEAEAGEAEAEVTEEEEADEQWGSGSDE